MGTTTTTGLQCGVCGAWTRLRCYICDDCTATLTTNLSRLDQEKSRLMSDYVQMDVRGDVFDRTPMQRIEKIDGYLGDINRSAAASFAYHKALPYPSESELLAKYREEVANLCARTHEGPGIALAIRELLDFLGTEGR